LPLNKHISKYTLAEFFFFYRRHVPHCITTGFHVAAIADGRPLSLTFSEDFQRIRLALDYDDDDQSTIDKPLSTQKPASLLVIRSFIDI
jgi:hypothetical protein